MKVMGCGQQARILMMMTMNFTYFLVELIVGSLGNSTTLVADSFHMLSDVAALVIAFIAVLMSPRKWSRSTFGFARAEVLGAFANCVFLLGLCFSIILKSVERFASPEAIEQPELVFYAALVGLIINLVGMVMFSDAHSHGHSHAKGGKANPAFTGPKDEFPDGIFTVREGSFRRTAVNVMHDTSDGFKSIPLTIEEPPEPDEKTAKNLNMQGVFLHVLADTLGSVTVIVSTVIVWQTDFQYKDYVDPALSLFIVILILTSAVPLLKESAMILLQTVPNHINIEELKAKVMTEEPGISNIHELHVWQLVGERVVASIHVGIDCNNDEYNQMEVQNRIKQTFHEIGIHSTTVQIECTDFNENLTEKSPCLIKCSPKSSGKFRPDCCENKTCCKSMDCQLRQTGPPKEIPESSTETTKV